MRRRLWSATTLVVAAGALLLLTPGVGQAQRVFNGYNGGYVQPNFGGYRGGLTPYGGGGYGNPGFAPYQNGWGTGYNPGYGYGNYNTPGYGYGNAYGNILNPGYGYNNAFAPSYYSPSYSNNGPAYSGAAYPYYSARNPNPLPTNSYQSYYPPSGAFQGNDRQQTENSALIRITVPPDAEIWFDGSKTTQTGGVRQFRTPALEANGHYSYQIRARWMQNGQERNETRELQVQPNKQATLDFTSPVAPR